MTEKEIASYLFHNPKRAERRKHKISAKERQKKFPKSKCRNARCIICHPEKNNKEIKLSERRFIQ